MTEKTIDQIKEDIKQNAMAEVMRIGEGNPGAITALLELVKNYSMMPLYQLDKMNIRGYKIWLGYKDFCNQDIDKFFALIMSHDLDMQDYIKKWET